MQLDKDLKKQTIQFTIPDEIIKIITDTLAEFDFKPASYCKSILMGDCEVAPDGENIWDPVI